MHMAYAWLDGGFVVVVWVTGKWPQSWLVMVTIEPAHAQLATTPIQDTMCSENQEQKDRYRRIGGGGGGGGGGKVQRS